MIESGYYPAGTEFDPRAPWNQSDPEPREFEVELSDVIVLTPTIMSEDYEEGVDEDEDGKIAFCEYRGNASEEFTSQFISLQEALKIAIPVLEGYECVDKKIGEALKTIKVYANSTSEIENA